MSWRGQLHNGQRTWLPAIFTGAAVLGFVATMLFGAYLLNERRKDNAQNIARVARIRMVEDERQRAFDLKLQVAVYGICRTEGHTRRQCIAIARGAILPSATMVPRLNTRTLRAVEAQITRLLVGPPGKQGRVGIGTLGARGLTGARGATGPRGFMGLRGFTGSRGADGAPGQRGATGATGPAGPQGAQGPPGGALCPAGSSFKQVRIPAVGAVWLCAIE